MLTSYFPQHPNDKIPAGFEVIAIYAECFNRSAWKDDRARILDIYETPAPVNRRATKWAFVRSIYPPFLSYSVPVSHLRKIHCIIEKIIPEEVQ